MPDRRDDYFTELAAQRRASTHTLAAYRRDLAKLLAFAGERELHTLGVSDIRRALMSLHSKELAPRSLARTLSGWRGYYAWLARHGHIAVNPTDGVKAPRRPRTLPKALGVDQVAAMLDAQPDDELEMRDAAMFELFYSSGLRLAELVSLDLSMGREMLEGEVRVTGKRGKTRIVPVGDKARTAIAHWLQQRTAIAAADELALFVSRNGNRLGCRQVELRLARWAQKAGVGVHVHPHMLRHSFASHVLQSSGDLRAVQDMLGHASISATQIYTHLDFQHLAKVYDQAHPRAKVK
ncbi:MAG: tyrosine recombinase XerC [Rhodocyclaceae bacterium]|nr:tyrosine recombinase XerC [Rhodocyclaceae bacterium]